MIACDLSKLDSRKFRLIFILCIRKLWEIYHISTAKQLRFSFFAFAFYIDERYIYAIKMKAK